MIFRNETDDDNSLTNGYDTDTDIRNEHRNEDARSIVSNSTCTIDIEDTMDREHQTSTENEGQYGLTVINEYKIHSKYLFVIHNLNAAKSDSNSLSILQQ